MRKIHVLLAMIAIFSTQIVFADEGQDMMSVSKSCATVAHACKKAGFEREKGAHKKFWVDCMKPVVLGKTVKGVSVDEATVKACRADKIEEMQKELKDLQAAS
ncbi:MAG: hypothetical protein P4M14_05350 [Gammaproteobacteria bacterium]|nr:hypothetical protein [Gammaproteobacteria bacterium]